MAELRQRRPPVVVDGRRDDGRPAHRHHRDEWSWSDIRSWPPDVKWSPALLALLTGLAALFYTHFLRETPFDLSSPASCRATFNYTFRVNAARHQVEARSARSWEVGTAIEAIESLIDPGKTVFAGAQAFPDGQVPTQGLCLDEALIWGYQKIGTNGTTLFDADRFGAADPASLGVAATMLGSRWRRYLDAAEREKEYLLRRAPRYANGAISHRREAKELWSEAVFMFPPFLAYYGVATGDLELVKTAFRQVMLYRDVLSHNRGPLEGLWRHIEAPARGEFHVTARGRRGNAFAAYGMARVRGDVGAWEPARSSMSAELAQLDQWVGEILDGAMRTDDHASGLLRNYLGDPAWFAETSGTSLFAATAYRMAVLDPARFGRDRYVSWAHRKRRAVVARIDEDGFAGPAVNPERFDADTPVEGSVVGESFLLLMGAAFRECVCAGVCEWRD
ncbi:Glycosyl Hydrolase Family 88 [Teratosphaeria destructans]|uniref:Glycosyl Hydrolase Family 88 n=1 Tax=Teratosphaeria destructans TaxID=418781 RepID=A0A9W7SYK7_9PEZI|nr:Glycosyl Hydrolase Family 88 [Teratosphaeria destructans]